MSFDIPENVNYAATIVKVPEPLRVVGLDNLVAIPLFGFQSLTQKADIKAGDLRVLFTAETQLDTEYAAENNLFREATLNRDANETGYLEPNARVKAIRLRKNNSNALLMPLSSLAYTGYDVSTLQPGDTFDKLNGHTICRKYVVPGKAVQGLPKGPKIRSRVDQNIFKMHLDTEQLFRNLHHFRDPKFVVVTQKLHGTSWRGGNVPELRDKGRLERFVNKWLKISTPDTHYKHNFGSRRVIKGRPDNNHFYDTDLWTEYGKKLDGMIPKNFIVYGELIGWVDERKPIQAGYTYNLKPGACELYVYRVATVNEDGIMADLSWAGVKDFCATLGLKHVPELWSGWVITDADFEHNFVERWSSLYLDTRYTDNHDNAVPLSDPKSVDEGICVRIEGQIPRVLKAKSPKFFEYETKQLDTNELNMEDAA
ncbi:RNA ligase family protein [Mycolicibacterium sphagni]|uniref:RNA ligase domain-containing protein n=1 Tax=Mycolicibacterium sphagni TaxID=1786 RepID=A0A255DQR0_9MYCO|nr:RNA ligase family protein [Mycolicibacterium sphagni]OYN81738.1 hypothetical protein CG716_05125 [Mycolicibacterium sphagni]